MTWTVTTGGVTAFSAGATSIALTGLTIAAGTGCAVSIQYSDFVADSPPSLTLVDSASNAGWTFLRSIVDASTGQGLAQFYNLALGTGLSSGSITAGFGTATLQNFGLITFKSSISGTPTLNGSSGLDNTTASTTPNSGAATGASSGNLIVSGIVSNGPGGLGTVALAMTGVTTPTVRNNQNTAAGYADGSGVTTSSGSVTSTWTLSGSTQHVVLQMVLGEPAAAAACVKGSLAMMGFGCAVLARKLEENPITTRRRLLIGRLGRF